ncbi:MAG: glycosyltransferase family 2 protein [Nocardioides sp.]|uniref:glycosyltransferase family 2 protein n=1 Tax=Nocardioides sp. TaxID=35761 RepID=UPI0039E49459
MSGLDTPSLVPRDDPSAGDGGSSTGESVAIVVVTYNRADMLARMLAGLAELNPAADAVVVVDNASTDHTARVLAEVREQGSLPGLEVITTGENLGGAGGFRLGLKHAYHAGMMRIWLMDDDVVPAPDCLGVLLAVDGDCLMAVREDAAGDLVEKAALRFDLRNPLAIRPKTAMVETHYRSRAAMPELVEIENVAFEGFMLRRRVVERIGLPDASYFIFYDDVDYALRARAAGFRILAVRDAVLVRQLDFSQQHDLAGWKGFYMYRNLFAVHFRYGANPLVRAKPYAIAAGVVLLSPLRPRRRGGTPGGRWSEARNVIRALRSARGMRRVPDTSVD